MSITKERSQSEKVIEVMVSNCIKLIRTFSKKGKIFEDRKTSMAAIG